MIGKLKRIVFSKLAFWVGLIVLTIVIVSVGFGLFWAIRLMRETGLNPDVVARLVLDDGMSLNSSNGRTNVLLLGIGGGNHDGADLTDTMMIFSLETQNRSVALISIPRDIWSDTLKDKVNSAYHYGELKKKGGGLLLAKVVAEDVAGMPIQYAFLIDFSGFKKVIDLLGGVDVKVSRAFTDNEYPIPGKEHDSCPGDPTNRCVYETIHFDAGKQHMDGERALEYVRSRHAEGAEGSDFARSRRQQDVIIALKEKIVNPSTWLSAERISALPKVFDEATDTDMNMGEIATIGKWFMRAKESAVKKIALETLLEQPPEYLYGGRFVLVPKETWDAVHSYIASQL